MQCPFCEEPDFDKIGLWLHLGAGGSYYKKRLIKDALINPLRKSDE